MSKIRNIDNNQFKLRTTLAKYFIPTENEWYKAAYYDPTLNSDSGGYWLYATRSNSTPIPVTANDIGDGIVNRNSANYNRQAVWNGVELFTTGGNVTTVGSNGASSYYGTYDQGGNLFEWNDLNETISSFRGLRGGSFSTVTANILSSSYRTTVPTESPNAFQQNILVGFRIASFLNPFVLPNFVTVGNINNNADISGYGSVEYQYSIAKYLVTNNEYALFLNSVASSDTYSLYKTIMTSEVRGGIIRSGTSGNYTYTVKSNMEDKPVNFINWFNAARYCNWLHNNKIIGPQDSTTTEDGAYTLNGAITGDAVAKNINAKYYIPTENEWYKAAYYDPSLNNGSGGYWSYATRSNSVPDAVSVDNKGNGILNFANFNRESDWNNEDGLVTTVGTNGGPSYYGTFDQSGNAYEWVDENIESNKVIMGGYWLNLLNNDEFRLSSTNTTNSTVPTTENSANSFRVGTISNPLNLSNFVTVGNPNNNNNITGYGGVSYTYQIGKYEVTQADYTEFLNAVASVDTYGLYNTFMDSSRSGITRQENGYRNAYISSYGIDFVPVTDIGNIPNPLAPPRVTATSAAGKVDYNFHMGKYEITNSQYCSFLNSIAKVDTNSLFNASMQISRSGSSGNYSYSPTIGNENKPVCFVSSLSIFRFANWLHNGCPIGSQNSSTTENGAYDMAQVNPTRKMGAKFWIPNVNEWYKTAYYDKNLNGGSGGYYRYPNRSNNINASIPPGDAFSANIDTIVGSTTNVGSYIDSFSPYGCYDMAGNISETLDDLISPGQIDNVDFGRMHSLSNWNFAGVTETAGAIFADSSSNQAFRFQTITGTNNRVGFRVAASFPTYSYDIKPNWNNKPVVFVSWFDCARYCNWLHNGKPSGNQDKNTTESGAYSLYGTMSGVSINRNSFKIRD